MSKTEILSRLETLSKKMRMLASKALKQDQKEIAFNACRYIEAMGVMAARDQLIFDVEPWHPLDDSLSLQRAGEMLLRVRDFQNEKLSPYSAVMMLYHNGFTEEFDAVLVLCALDEFRRRGERQVSINVSCRSLQNEAFVSTVLAKIESMKLKREEKIIFEIHESNAVIEIPSKTARMFKKLGVQFAIDDVGLSMNDVFRLSAFEGLADYIKLDRQSVNGHPDDPKALAHILSLAHSLLPNAQMVAEGIQNVGHAYDVLKMHPSVCYVQGLFLPDRATFARQWKLLLREKQNGAKSAL